MLLKTITWMRWVAFIAAVGPVATLVTGCANGQERPSDHISTSHSPPALGGSSTTARPELHAVTVGDITAHFGGAKPPIDLDVPLRFGVTALWFTFPGDESAYVFKPAGELFFSDWNFDIFSPDGAHVLLLQDHYGPYHIVKTGSLKHYLTGRTGPDHIVTKATTANQPVLIHSEGRWVTPREIRFVVTCCGTKEIVTSRLP